ncbi:MAG: ATP-binding protein, partial [Coriobacteriales bacterium]|nr:ATP-binding protein [Coriobacteriales bacterium]
MDTQSNSFAAQGERGLHSKREAGSGAAYIPRALEPLVLSLSQEYPVLLLTGPRQTGKTTMLKRLMEGTQRSYISLDSFETRRDAQEDPARFLQRYQPPLLIDEVQYAPQLLTYIKIVVDERGRPGDYWLTGSQVFKLMRGVQESLAGRVAHLKMSPLSQSEIARSQNVPFTVDRERLLAMQDTRRARTSDEVFETMYRGSMPALVGDKHNSTAIFYSSYLDSYIERDVRDLSPGLDSFRFLDFIKSAAIRCGQVVNFASMARDAGISEKTAKGWLGLLETLGIVVLLYPSSNTALSRTLKSPKLYFFDTGLAAHLAGFD